MPGIILRGQIKETNGQLYAVQAIAHPNFLIGSGSTKKNGSFRINLSQAPPIIKRQFEKGMGPPIFFRVLDKATNRMVFETPRITGTARFRNHVLTLPQEPKPQEPTWPPTNHKIWGKIIDKRNEPLSSSEMYISAWSTAIAGGKIAFANTDKLSIKDGQFTLNYLPRDQFSEQIRSQLDQFTVTLPNGGPDIYLKIYDNRRPKKKLLLQTEVFSGLDRFEQIIITLTDTPQMPEETYWPPKQYIINGFVMDAYAEEPTEGLPVQAYALHPNIGSQPIAYGKTDKNGEFTLDYRSVDTIPNQLIPYMNEVVRSLPNQGPDLIVKVLDPDHKEYIYTSPRLTGLSRFEPLAIEVNVPFEENTIFSPLAYIDELVRFITSEWSISKEDLEQILHQDLTLPYKRALKPIPQIELAIEVLETRYVDSLPEYEKNWTPIFRETAKKIAEWQGLSDLSEAIDQEAPPEDSVQLEIYNTAMIAQPKLDDLRKLSDQFRQFWQLKIKKEIPQQSKEEPTTTIDDASQVATGSEQEFEQLLQLFIEPAYVKYRSLLIKAIITELKSDTINATTQDIENSLFIDLQSNQNTLITRATQLIQSLQSLVQAVRTQEIKEIAWFHRTTISNFLLDIDPTIFNTDLWHWLKTYRDWNAAIYAFYYTENLLPAPRRTTTMAWNIVASLEGNSHKPERIDEIYQEYFDSLNNIRVIGVHILQEQLVVFARSRPWVSTTNDSTITWESGGFPARLWMSIFELQELEHHHSKQSSEEVFLPSKWFEIQGWDNDYYPTVVFPKDQLGEEFVAHAYSVDSEPTTFRISLHGEMLGEAKFPQSPESNVEEGDADSEESLENDTTTSWWHSFLRAGIFNDDGHKYQRLALWACTGNPRSSSSKWYRSWLDERSGEWLIWEVMEDSSVIEEEWLLEKEKGFPSLTDGAIGENPYAINLKRGMFSTTIVKISKELEQEVTLEAPDPPNRIRNLAAGWSNNALTYTYIAYSYQGYISLKRINLEDNDSGNSMRILFTTSEGKRKTWPQISWNPTLGSNPWYLERYFYYPILSGWILNRAGNFSSAHSVYLRLYDPFHHNSHEVFPFSRKFTNEFALDDEWIDTLSDLDSLAQNRKGCFLRHTLLMMAKNILDWADHEFAQNNIESLNRARELYGLASRVLDEPILQIDYKEELKKMQFQSGNSYAVPANPLLEAYQNRAKNGLVLLRNGFDINGEPNSKSILPTGNLEGRVISTFNQLSELIGQSLIIKPHYRYSYLIEKARQYASLAQQLEASMLSAIEKRDDTALAVLQAEITEEISNATVGLKNILVNEANQSIIVAETEIERAVEEQDFWAQRTLFGPLNANEQMSLALIQISGGLQSEAATLAKALAAPGAAMAGIGAFNTLLGGTIAASGIGAIPGGVIAAGGLVSLGVAAIAFGEKMVAAKQTQASALSTYANLASTMASYERRWEEWQHQKSLAEVGVQLANEQKKLASYRLDFAHNEKAIAEMQHEHTKLIVDFWKNRFSNEQLYQWMIKILMESYRDVMQRAVTIAKLVQDAVEFERQKEVSIIQGDYWTLDEDTLTEEQRASGLLGAERLLTDLTQLDEWKTTTDRRRLQISKTISLAKLAPLDFQQFRQTGHLQFRTLMEWFDQDFPGHYMRLIKSVKISIAALVPPLEGIHAMLYNTGVSNVVVCSEGGQFIEQHAISKEPESIALDGPTSESGLFVLSYEDPMLLPFEGLGVATEWIFELLKGSNQFDYDTIVDVFFTIDYTAMNSQQYREQVIQRLGTNQTADIMISLRRNYSDAWYHLFNPQSPSEEQSININLPRDGFPGSKSTQFGLKHLMVFLEGDEGKNVDSIILEKVGTVGFPVIQIQTDNSGVYSTRNLTPDGTAVQLDQNGFPMTPFIDPSHPEQLLDPSGEWQLRFEPNWFDGKYGERRIDGITDIILVPSVEYEVAW